MVGAWQELESSELGPTEEVPKQSMTDRGKVQKKLEPGLGRDPADLQISLSIAFSVCVCSAPEEPRQGWLGFSQG